MSYHILEERKIDKDGNYVPPSDFYVVDEVGNKVSERLGSLNEAIDKLQKLEKLEVENKRKNDSGLGR